MQQIVQKAAKDRVLFVVVHGRRLARRRDRIASRQSGDAKGYVQENEIELGQRLLLEHVEEKDIQQQREEIGETSVAG